MKPNMIIKLNQQVVHRILNGALVISLLGLAVSFSLNIRRAHAQGQIVSAHSVVLQEVLTTPQGRKVMGALYKFSTRADGSRAFVGIDGPTKLESPARMVDFSSGVRAYVSDTNRQKYVRQPPKDWNPGQMATRIPSSHCALYSVGEAPLGTEQIGGYRAEKISQGNRTSWYAADFGCALVKEHFDWEDGSKSDKTLLSLTPGEPDSALFSLPTDYADVPRSVIAP